MFASIVSKVSQLVRNTVRTIGAIARRSPWVIPTAILVVFLFV